MQSAPTFRMRAQGEIARSATQWKDKFSVVGRALFLCPTIGGCRASTPCPTVFSLRFSEFAGVHRRHIPDAYDGLRAVWACTRSFPAGRITKMARASQVRAHRPFNLKEADETIERRQWLKAQRYDFQKVASRAGEPSGMNAKEVIKPGKQPHRVKAKSLVCHWALLELGLVGTSVAKMLGISQSAVSKAVQRGGKLAADKGYTLSDERKF